LALALALALAYKMVCPEGLEPPTCCLEGNCSIQLSYGQREKHFQTWLKVHLREHKQKTRIQDAGFP
jgi:hypothetical protein